MRRDGALLTINELLGCAALLLLLMSASSWLLIRWDNEARQLLTRINEFATPYARASALNRMGRRQVSDSHGARLRSALAALMGHQSDRASQYPVKAPIIVILAFILAVVISQVFVSLLGPVARLALPLLWIATCRRTFTWFEQRRSNQLYRQFPDALAMIVRSIRVGIPVSEALRNVSLEALEPTNAEFALLNDQITVGVALDEALSGLATRNQLSEYRFFATALSLQAQTGGGLSETLENLADVIRKRVAIRNRAYAMASEARTSTYILAALPVVAGVAVSILNPAYAALLFTDPTGQAVLAVTVAMLGTGMLVMRTIISRALR